MSFLDFNLDHLIQTEDYDTRALALAAYTLSADLLSLLREHRVVSQDQALAFLAASAAKALTTDCAELIRMID